MYGKGWNALYMENHDHPRIISRYGSEKYRVESGKSIAASYLFQRGTPFVYQGQEIGMINTPLPSLDDYKDIMVKNNARIARSLGLSRRLCSSLRRRPRAITREPACSGPALPTQDLQAASPGLS